jgi:hypothetical protein
MPATTQSRVFHVSICYPRIFNQNIQNYIILPVVFNEFATLSLTLREEHRLGVFKKWVLRNILRPTREEVRGHCRKLHNHELRGS